MWRVMWIEDKSSGLAGPARIGWVNVCKGGRRLEYRDQVFRTLKGQGFKSNYYDVETGAHYWISGCRKDGRDALYGTDVTVDADALDEYWLVIRKQPDNRDVRRFRASGKYRK